MLIGALAGAVFGYLCLGTAGLLGAVPGLAIALFVVQRTVMPEPDMIIGRFISSSFAVVGAVSCRHDDDSAQGLAAIQALFDKLQLDAGQRRKARAGLRRGRLRSFNIDDEMAGVARMCTEYKVSKNLFLHMQIHVLAADRTLYKAERDIMGPVAQALGVSQAELREAETWFDVRRARRDNARANHDHGRRQDRQQQQQQRRAGRAADGLLGAYSVLGIGPEASDVELKTAYRRQMSAHHPDKVAGRGLPDGFRRIYERKTREVSAAYDRIRTHRGLA